MEVPTAGLPLTFRLAKPYVNPRTRLPNSKRAGAISLLDQARLESLWEQARQKGLAF